MGPKVRGKKSPLNFIYALENATRRFPDASWHYIADDDSFVHLGRLQDIAAKYNKHEYHYVGQGDCIENKIGDLQCMDTTTQPIKCHRQHMTWYKGHYRFPGWACGGGGILISRPLAKAVVAQNCSRHYSDGDDCEICFGDMA